MGFQPGGRKGFLGGSRNVSKICISVKIYQCTSQNFSNYPHLNNFTLHCTYITHALKYIEPVLGHIVHVPKSTHVQCKAIYVQCAFSAYTMICNYVAS